MPIRRAYFIHWGAIFNNCIQYKEAAAPLENHCCTGEATDESRRLAVTRLTAFESLIILKFLGLVFTTSMRFPVVVRNCTKLSAYCVKLAYSSKLTSVHGFESSRVRKFSISNQFRIRRIRRGKFLIHFCPHMNPLAILFVFNCFLPIHYTISSLAVWSLLLLIKDCFSTTFKPVLINHNLSSLLSLHF